MKAVQRSALGLVLGSAVAASSLTSVAAQTAKAAPAYVMLEFTVKDPEAFKDYAQRSPATVTQHGGKFVVRPGTIIALKGDAPKGPFAVLAFDSAEQAQKWASSPEYTALVPLRDKSADVRIFVVEGVGP
jgi:uncharacterized protein (DUF1330 family)